MRLSSLFIVKIIIVISLFASSGFSFRLGGLVSYWSFDKTDLKADISGNGNNLTVSRGPTAPSGWSGYGKCFVGTAERAKGINAFNNPNGFSIVFSYHQNNFDITSWARIFTAVCTDGKYMSIEMQDNMLWYKLYDTNSDLISYFILNPGQMPGDWPRLNAWHTLVMTVDYQASTVCFYADGKKQDVYMGENDPSLSAPLGDFITPTTKYPYRVYLGNGNATWDKNFALDEFQIYNRPLSQGEAQRMNAAAYYPCDDTLASDGSVLAIRDFSGHNSDAKIVSTQRGWVLSPWLNFAGKGAAYDMGTYTGVKNSLSKITAVNTPYLNVLGSMTYAGYVKWNSLPPTRLAATFMEKGIRGAAPSVNYKFGALNGMLNFGYTVGGTWVNVYDASSWRPVVGNWYHIAIAVDKETNSVSFYVDGVLKSTVVDPVGLNYMVNDKAMYIGKNSANDETAWAVLDEVYLFPKAIDQTTIQSLIGHGCPKPVVDGDTTTVVATVETADDLTVSPNPCNPSTVITVPKGEYRNATLKIFSTSGQQVASFTNLTSSKVVWNAAHFAAGTYVVKCQIGKTSYSKKILLIK